MSTQHTPGPWIQNPGPDYGNEENKRANQLYVRLGNGSANAIVERKNVFEKVSNEDLANARLIAAAPELLDALNGVLALIHGAGLPWNNATAIVNAAAAIAKATGKDQG